MSLLIAILFVVLVLYTAIKDGLISAIWAKKEKETDWISS